jgi:transposase
MGDPRGKQIEPHLPSLPHTVHVSRISALVAAALCMKPRPMLSQRQLLTLDLLKNTLPGFRIMRQLSIQFRALLRSRKPERLSQWIADAKHSGLYALQRFAKTLQRDEDAVRNAIADPWSSGQVEGQINRLKTLKRAMYGRPSRELLQARMLPLHQLLTKSLFSGNRANPVCNGNLHT